ncbi:MAG: 16S rRNA (uracil(1498)-N(3))-methyltransferase [Actinomycetota bacterium]
MGRGAHAATTAPWFFAPPEEWGTGEITLPADESHHALRVMRIEPPDLLTVFDGRGSIARCAAARIDAERLVAEVLERDDVRPPTPHLAVYQAAPKGHKADEVVERLAELGVAEVVLFEAERSVVRWDTGKLHRLTERWAGIARSAAKQSRSPFLLRCEGGVPWTDLVARIEREPSTVVLWEHASLPLRVALDRGPSRIALVVGPEGGFAPSEAEELAGVGAQLVSLGPRILRTEHAPVVAATAVLFHYGLIG